MTKFSTLLDFLIFIFKNLSKILFDFNKTVLMKNTSTLFLRKADILN